MKVELRDIHKHFGKVHANEALVMNIPSGTIQGILGENGAGKSTLMKILSGFIHADSGEIFWTANRSHIIAVRTPSITGLACCTRIRWIFHR